MYLPLDSNKSVSVEGAMKVAQQPMHFKLSSFAQLNTAIQLNAIEELAHSELPESQMYSSKP